VDDLVATARAAGLTVQAVTSSMMALASATGGEPGARRLVLRLAPNEAELGVQSGGSVRLLRRLPGPPRAAGDPSAHAAGAPPPVAGSPAADGWLEGLAGELRRVVALLPGAPTPQPAPELLIWNESGLPAGALGTLGPRLALDMRLCGYPADLGLADGPAPSGGRPAPAGGEYAAAAALALAGLGPAALAVDFAHSRLSPRKKLALRNKVVWGGGLAALLLLAGLALLLDVRGEEQAVQDLKDQLGGMKESLAAAKEIVDKATFARGWYDRRSRHLDCLRELTLAFPLEGRIWTTSLAISEDMRVLLSGKASDEGAVLEVLDHLKGSPKFSDVKPLYIREVGGGTRDVSFAISLNFVKAERS
jgi:hypothetical protein